MSPLQIAIDGPVGAGKSDISARLAKKLGIIYIYTGAMYRAVAYLCFQNQVGYKDEQNVLPLLKRHKIDLLQPQPADNRAFRVLIDNQDITSELFNPEMDRGSSDVSTLPKVRTYLVALQKQISKGKNVVMEGRDITYRVLPKAQLKIFLTASLQERANRRLLLAKNKGLNKSLKEIITNIKTRDLQDTTRKSDPLKKIDGAWELDTTGLNQNQVVQKIIDKLRQMKLL